MRVTSFMRMHLVNGEVIEGAPETIEITEQEIQQSKAAIADIVMGSGGWQLNMELANGSWVVVPKQSVLYVEVVMDKE